MSRPATRDGQIRKFSANGAGPDEEARLAVITAKAICALPDPPGSDEVVGPFVRRGQRTILGGATGHGKSSMAIQAAGAVAERREFLGFAGCGGRVLIVDVEQGERTIKRRLREADLAQSESVDYLRAPDGLRLDSDEGEVAEVERIIAEGGYALVVPEPLYKLHSGDSNDERHAVDLMRRFDAWRELYGFALLLTTHVRKRQPQSGKFSMDDLFGSGAYLRGAEIVLGLQRTRPGAARLHIFKDRDGDLPAGEAWGLLFDRDQGFRRDPEDGVRVTAPEKVRDLLEADPGMTSEQAATGYKERTVRDALRALNATGVGKPKRWTLPEGEQGELT